MVYLVAPISIFNFGALPKLLIIFCKDVIAFLILSTKPNFEDTVFINAVILSSLGTNKFFSKFPNKSIILYPKNSLLKGFNQFKRLAKKLSTSFKIKFSLNGFKESIILAKKLSTPFKIKSSLNGFK